MGGRRYSALAMARERAAKLELIQQITALQSAVDGYQQELAKLLRSSTPGIRETFARQVESAEKWGPGAEKVLAHAAEMDRSVGELEGMLGDSSEIAAEGQQLVKEIGLSFTKVGDQMARDLAYQLVHVRALVAAHRRECTAWFPKEVCQWATQLDAASSQLDRENYGEVTAKLTAIETEVTELARHSRALASKQQSRLYLLKAVRQVCRNLGMRETAPPRYELPGDATGRILFRVASPDRGEIAFALSLEGIHTQAQPGRCLTDLEKLSRFLAADYGIGTSFRKTAHRRDPELPHGKARALPRALPEDYDATSTA